MFWVFPTFMMPALFVPVEAFDLLIGDTTIPLPELVAVPRELIPIFVVNFASVLDTFSLGLWQVVTRADRLAVEDAEEPAATAIDFVVNPGAVTVTYSECDREIDADIDFYHRCTTPLDGPANR